MTFIHILAHSNNNSEKHGYVEEKRVKKSMIRKYCPKKVLHQYGQFTGLTRRVYTEAELQKINTTDRRVKEQLELNNRRWRDTNFSLIFTARLSSIFI